MLKEGVRVIRGPNWKYGDQDNGCGHVGTIRKISADGKKVLVDWDKQLVLQLVLPMLGLMNEAQKYNEGDEYWYRTGADGCYDISVLDTGEAGVSHEDTMCDSCKVHPVKGMRWQCKKCADYDLCTTCYMSDIHDTCHPFIRVDVPLHPGVKVSGRCYTPQIRLFGLKTSDWNGRRLMKEGVPSEENNNTQVCYKDHLPLIGMTDTSEDAHKSEFSVGDKVEVKVNEIGYLLLQANYGGVTTAMMQEHDSIGTVIHVKGSGTPMVQYKGCVKSYTINPEALIKRSGCSCITVGDVARVLVLEHLIRGLR